MRKLTRDPQRIVKRLDWNPPRSLTHLLPPEWQPASPGGPGFRNDMNHHVHFTVTEQETMARVAAELGRTLTFPGDHAPLPTRLGGPWDGTPGRQGGVGFRARYLKSLEGK